MKNFMFAAIAAAAMAFAGVASADTYVGVGASTSITDVGSFSLDDGMNLDVVAGTDVDGILRVEGRAARLNQDTNLFGATVQVSAIQLGADAFVDIGTGTRVTPYVGAGFQYTDGQAGLLGSNIDFNGWGYNAQVGARVKLTESVSLDAGVRYGVNELNADVFGDFDATQTELRVGVDVAL